MRIGSVVAPGPVAKLAMTRSSRERVNARRKAVTIAGAICGSATRTKASGGVAPRSIAASSSVGSQSRSAARSATVVKAHRQRNMTDDKRDEASSDAERDETGEQREAEHHLRQNQRRMHGAEKQQAACESRQNAPASTAARRPSTVAIVAEVNAAARLIFAECRSCAFSRSAAYHFVENPPHTETRREALKLMTARMTIGA